ncbi:MAG: CehA/McbA family metallohydrolase, partial [Eubacteriales bacterium]|nr:CehA/McbA family metallohydrolase [Eubacteriales bacterium]
MRGKVRKTKRFLGLFLAVLMMVVSCIGNAALVVTSASTSGKHVVIQEVYGGGGNSGAVYTNDFIVLYNPTDEAVTLEGWSVQYASAGTTGAFNSSNVTSLTGSIGAGSYYLIKEAAGSNSVKELPAPDAAGTLAMAGKGGQIALVKNSEAITGKDDADVVDFIGIGTSKQYEGEAAAATANGTSASRDELGTDTDNNKNDFTVGKPNPKNSKSTAVSQDKVANVTATPDSCDVVEGQELTLTCDTEGVAVYYTINGGEKQTYDSSAKPKLNSLPATVVVWGEKTGLKDSDKNTYQYKKKAVAAVSATPSSSSVELGTKVELSCQTEGAIIVYSVDNGATWNKYTEAITLNKLPSTVLAKAAATGYDESIVSTFDYKEKKNDTTHTGDYNIYFGQLHSHTNLSDGAGTVTQAFEHASKAANLDFLAVTDHSNSFEGSTYTNTLTESAMDNEKWSEGKNAASAITASKIANTDNVTDSASTFLGIYGFEMTWSDGSGHINTFNTAGFENRNNSIYANKKQSAANPSGLQMYYSKLAAADGSVSQFNHPGTTFGDFYDFTNYSAINDARINLIEVGNGEGAVGSGAYFPSYSYYTRALDKGWHVAPTNNQDNHKGNWGDSNTTRSVILADELTEESLYDALSNRRVYATEDNDLSIQYTLNGSVMGTILNSSADTVSIEAKLSDPTDAGIGRVEVIVNGGRVAASQTVTENNATVKFDLKNDYSYYYLRITQEDGNIAVTAPVWTGEVEKAGIASVTTQTALPIKGEELTIETSLYNNEDTDMTVEEISYSADGTVIHTVKGENLEGGAVVAALGEKTYGFAYTPDKNGDVIITATMKALIKGVEHTYNVPLTLSVSDPKTVTKVVIDGTHLNDYVNGYYKGNMTNFIDICAAQGIQAVIETEKITKEMLSSTDMLVITAPLKYDKNGEMTPASFSDDFMKLVSDYVNGGG